MPNRSDPDVARKDTKDVVEYVTRTRLAATTTSYSKLESSPLVGRLMHRPAETPCANMFVYGTYADALA